MKRSCLNALMQDADAFFRSCHFYLPPFAYWTPADWAARGVEVQEIVDRRLGWDITDYGLGDFARYGLLLFTLRNGRGSSPPGSLDKPYCEKVMVAEMGQTHQMHMHRRKMEDIINRGGGRLVIELYNVADGETLAGTDVRVNCDGVWRTLPAGTEVRLGPGESVTLTPRVYHRFWAEGARVLIGEVSTPNDDETDNHYHQMIGTGRFSGVTEDAAPLYLLCAEYERFWRGRIISTEKGDEGVTRS